MKKFLKYTIVSEKHISHLRAKSEQEVNRVLSMTIDFDNIYSAMNREENAETKKVYGCLFRVSLLSLVIWREYLKFNYLNLYKHISSYSIWYKYT